MSSWPSPPFLAGGENLGCALEIAARPSRNLGMKLPTAMMPTLLVLLISGLHFIHRYVETVSALSKLNISLAYSIYVY